MKHLNSFKIFESSNVDVISQLVSGYYSIIKSENDLDNQLLELKELVLPLIDESDSFKTQQSLFTNIRKSSYSELKVEPDSWYKKGISQISVAGKIWHVKELPIPESFPRAISFIKNCLTSTNLFFGVDLFFKNLGLAKGERLSPKSPIIGEFKLIKQELESRGWSINRLGWGSDWIVDSTNAFCFDVTMEVDSTLANEWAKNYMLENEIH